MTTTKVLLTGAGGFTGSHVLRHLLMNTNWNIICPVTFRHRGNGDRIASSVWGNDAWHQRVQVDMVDLTAPIPETVAHRWGDVDYILNVASESHVDRSLDDPVPFVRNNVELILNVLEYARVVKPRLFLQMSTDEVFGPAPHGYDNKEWDSLIPSNPYSASKAAQESIAISYWRAYGVPLIITNTMNLFGEMQHPEKYFAKVICAIQRDESVPVHVGPNGEMGSRFYIHARNFADAWLHLIRLYDDPGAHLVRMGDSDEDPAHYAFSAEVKNDRIIGSPKLPMYPLGDDRPARYNIVGDREVNNLELAELIASHMGKSLKWEPINFHSSRPGHDLRYALNGIKLANTGWKSPTSFEDSVRNTVRWMLAHPEWL